MIVVLAIGGWVTLAVLLAPVIGRALARADVHRPSVRRVPMLPLARRQQVCRVVLPVPRRPVA